MIINKFDTKDKVFIIAEIGNNHEGDFDLAKKLIYLASESGANAVKFQTIVPEKLIFKEENARLAQLRNYQFSQEQFKDLSVIAQEEGLIFLSTPFDLESANFLNDLVSAFKISSGDNTFFPLIEQIVSTGKPIIMSTGMLRIKELEKSVEFIKGKWENLGIKQSLGLLHCVSSYPTSTKDANLSKILSIKKYADVVGYSDHTMGIEAAILSVGMGARIVEKHFTIDNNFSTFHDHKLSADPRTFKLMVEKIREAELLMGKYTDELSNSELNGRTMYRRSVIFNKI